MSVGLVVRDLVVVRGGVAVVDGVSLTVAAGEVVVLVGPNGAGKSSVLAALTGDLRARSGELLVGGRPWASWRRHERAQAVVVLPQHPEAALGLSAGDVVSLGLELTSGRADRRAVDAALRAVELETFIDRPVATLSGGQRQRVHLARVLAQVAAGPRLVLLDEPLSAQDPGRAGLVLGHLRRLADAGNAVLVVLHDLGAAAAVADRLVLMDDGRVVQRGDADAVLSLDRLRTVYGPALDAGRCPDTGRHWVVPRPLETP